MELPWHLRQGLKLVNRLEARAEIEPEHCRYVTPQTRPSPFTLPLMDGVLLIAQRSDAAFHLFIRPSLTFASLFLHLLGLRSLLPPQLKHDGESFSTALSAGLLGIEERYPLSGDERSHRRRDMRSGMSRGNVAVDNDGVVTLRNEWQAPLAGHATEKFTLLDSRTLLVETCMRFTTKNEGVAYRSVYRR